MSNRYEFVVNLAKEAGERVLAARDKHIEISTKNNDPRDIVTNVDIEISDFISEKIKETFPGEKIYSEEADEDVSSGSFWSIDPVDGTACFSRGVPHYAVVIAYVESGVPVTGAIYNPVTREMFSFEKGKGAFFNSKRVHVSDIKSLKDAHVFIRAGRNKELWDWGANAYRFLLGHANKTANFGSSALDMCFVGAGRIEASVYGNLTAIDIIAAIGFVREAGGIVIGRGGKEITVMSKEKQSIVAANNREILEALKEGIDI
jgi:myo-inositol-1(or 4)-monophosphatase